MQQGLVNYPRDGFVDSFATITLPPGSTAASLSRKGLAFRRGFFPTSQLLLLLCFPGARPLGAFLRVITFERHCPILVMSRVAEFARQTHLGMPCPKSQKAAKMP